MSGRYPHIQDPTTFMESLEALFRRAEALGDPAVRDLVLDIADAVMHIHHEALFRVVVLLRNLPGGGDVLKVLEGDQVVGPLLREHGLLDGAAEPAPEPLEARIEAALDGVRPYMNGHGGSVELVEVRNGVARLQLQGACHGCASSTLTLKMGVEQALKQAVPELTAIEVEGLPAVAPASQRPAPAAGFIPVDSIAPAKVWKEVGAAEAFTYGTRHVAVNGAAVLLCSAFGRIYAVKDRCPRGGGSLRDARLEAFLLVCPCHDERYDLRSGHSLLEPTLSLDHVPIVIDHGKVRVAVG